MALACRLPPAAATPSVVLRDWRPPLRAGPPPPPARRACLQLVTAHGSERQPPPASERPTVRVNKTLVSFASRREADRLVADGVVTVNGKVRGVRACTL